MKKFHTAVLVLAAGAAIAFAATGADANGRRSIRDWPAAPFSWTGIYFGAHLGQAWADVDWGLDYPFGNPPASSSFQNDGVIYGGQVGVLQQYGPWVLGAELSLSTGFDKDRISGVNLFGGATVGTLDTDIDWLLLATVRAGYAWDRWLAYVKGGYAGAMISLATDDNVPPDFVSRSREMHHGWTVGGGLEYAITSGVSLGVEYNFVDLNGDDSVPVINSVTGNQVGTSRAVSDADTTIHSLMARLNVRLGK